MTLGGWVVMLGSIGLVTGLLIFCVVRILRSPEAAERVHPPSDLEPHEKPPA